ncbi:hypothetical protein ABKN59_010899 [Abortiporus biennis]
MKVRYDRLEEELSNELSSRRQSPPEATVTDVEMETPCAQVTEDMSNSSSEGDQNEEDGEAEEGMEDKANLDEDDNVMGSEDGEDEWEDDPLETFRYAPL